MHDPERKCFNQQGKHIVFICYNNCVKWFNAAAIKVEGWLLTKYIPTEQIFISCLNRKNVKGKKNKKRCSPCINMFRLAFKGWLQN